MRAPGSSPFSRFFELLSNIVYGRHESGGSSGNFTGIFDALTPASLTPGDDSAVKAD